MQQSLLLAALRDGAATLQQSVANKTLSAFLLPLVVRRTPLRTTRSRDISSHAGDLPHHESSYDPSGARGDPAGPQQESTQQLQQLGAAGHQPLRECRHGVGMLTAWPSYPFLGNVPLALLGLNETLRLHRPVSVMTWDDVVSDPAFRQRFRRLGPASDPPTPGPRQPLAAARWSPHHASAPSHAGWVWPMAPAKPNPQPPHARITHSGRAVPQPSPPGADFDAAHLLWDGKGCSSAGGGPPKGGSGSVLETLRRGGRGRCRTHNARGGSIAAAEAASSPVDHSTLARQDGQPHQLHAPGSLSLPSRWRPRRMPGAHTSTLQPQQHHRQSNRHSRGEANDGLPDEIDNVVVLQEDENGRLFLPVDQVAALLELQALKTSYDHADEVDEDFALAYDDQPKEEEELLGRGGPTEDRDLRRAYVAAGQVFSTGPARGSLVFGYWARTPLG